MNNTLDTLKKIYKPYKYTIKGKCVIFESTSGNVIIKEKENADIIELFRYLHNRNFLNYPKLIEDNRDNVIVYEYLEDIKIPKEQKMDDLINLVVSLHDKTSYYKEVTSDKYKSIYENILQNILYIEKFYNDLIDQAEDELFPSPSNSLLLVNSYKIFSALEFSKRELEEWFQIVKDKTKQRVVLVHNNLRLDHFIKNKTDYLISWDKAYVDTPVKDLFILYKNEGLSLDFSDKLENYLNLFSLNEDELKLFFILITIPDLINVDRKELDNVKEIRYTLDYIYKTEELIRPYYSKEKKE